MNRKLILIAAGVSFVMLLGWWFLMWSPAGSDIEAADRRYRNAQSQAQELTVQLQRLEATQARMPELQSRFLTLTEAVPQTAAMSDFLLSVTDASIASGLDFLTHSATPPRPSDDGADMMTVDLQMTANGGYFQTLDFINRLSSIERVFVIDDVTVAAQATNEEELLAGPPDLNVTISGRLFLSDLSAPAGVAEGA